MLKLIRNDLVGNGMSLVSLFIALNALLVGSIVVTHTLRESILTGLWFALITPLPILLRAEQSKSIVLYRSLPVDKSTFVWSKYCSVILVAVLTVVYTILYLYII